MSKFKWYFTARATREYIAIAGLSDDDGGPHWARAERELAAHSESAWLVANKTGESGAAIYRTGRIRVGDRTQSIRLEFYVLHNPREEGSLPQLVRVRRK